MKLRTSILISCLMLPLALKAGDLRTFTSADGSKSMEATLVDFDGKAITIDLEGGKRITAPITSFSKEDEAFAQKFLEKSAAARQLAVDFTEAEDEPSSKTANRRTIISRAEGYDVEFRNNGDKVLDGLSADYQIFWAKDEAHGGSVPKVATGSLTISELAPRGEVVLATDKIPLTTNKSAPSSSP